jgi:hypothetical protein
MKNSAPGLDQILVTELKFAASWPPTLLTDLAELFNCIENSQRWPQVLTKGVVSFIPKDVNNPQPKPDEFRPITILNTAYRLWAAVRHSHLVDTWFPLWKHSKAFGGKFSKSADQLAYETCLQIETASVDHLHAAGIAFDLQKCFDTVPCTLAFDIFSARGADLCVVQALRSFYKSHTKFFRLEGHHSDSFKPTCGILQGCPLSMLLLTSVITCWLEHNETSIPSAVSRAYADDMSAVAVGNNKQIVKTALVKVYEATEKFSSLAGMTISKKKSCTFGAKDYHGCVPHIEEHMDTFRLVGCSVKLK